MVARLQEPARTPAMGDSGRMWDVGHGVRLAEISLNGLCGDASFTSTAKELWRLLGELENIVEANRDSNRTPANLLPKANGIQRAQKCVQKTLAWRTAHPESVEDAPEVILLLGSSCDSIVRPVPSFTGTSDVDVQSLLHARLQASRRA